MGELLKSTICETVRQPRNRLTGQPQERQHSGGEGAPRERLPPARGAVFLARGIVTEGRDAIPLAGSRAARGAERVEPSPEGALNRNDNRLTRLAAYR